MKKNISKDQKALFAEVKQVMEEARRAVRFIVFETLLLREIRYDMGI